MILEMNSRELHSFELIAALDTQLNKKTDKGEHALKRRLQTIPNGWRDFRMVTAVLGRLVEQIYDTMPVNRIRYMQTLCENGEVLVRIKPAAKSDENILMPVSALKVLVNLAMDNKCTMCFEGHEGVKKCALRKALIECAPPVDLSLGDCPYRYVVENNEREQYI